MSSGFRQVLEVFFMPRISCFRIKEGKLNKKKPPLLKRRGGNIIREVSPLFEGTMPLQPFRVYVLERRRRSGNSKSLALPFDGLEIHPTPFWDCQGT